MMQQTVPETRIVAEPGKQDAVTTRTFDAPRELMFKVVTDPRLIPQWWGPANMFTTVEKLETRPGGLWRYVSRDANGRTSIFHGVFHLYSLEKIIKTFEYSGAPGHVALETSILEETEGGKTRLITQNVFQSAEDRDGAFNEDMLETISETFERLDIVLTRLQGNTST